MLHLITSTYPSFMWLFFVLAFSVIFLIPFSCNSNIFNMGVGVLGRGNGEAIEKDDNYLTLTVGTNNPVHHFFSENSYLSFFFLGVKI